MNRREFLSLAASCSFAQSGAPPGSVLVHEHIMVDFAGADKIGPGRYDPEEVFRLARAKLEELKPFGCARLLECTPDFIGRDARLIRRLADATGIDIWTNTGLYAAANYKFVPRFVHEEEPPRVAKRFIEEARRGIDGVKPRFIKSGVNKGPLGAIDRKLVRACAIAARETGLTLAVHTGDGRAALDQLEILDSERLAPSQWVWVHAQNEKDHSFHERAARAGGWVEFDGIREASAGWHLACVRHMAAHGLLSRTLISQDSGWYHVGEPGGGSYRGYTYIYTDFVRKLDPAWVKPLLVDNPRAAFGK
jgi:phosphotriesterase-related protein